MQLYKDKFGVNPQINGAIVGKLIKNLLKNHSLEGLNRIIELYFEDPTNEKGVYHLPSILSSWSLNKYLPKMRYNPDIYDDVEEINKKLY